MSSPVNPTFPALGPELLRRVLGCAQEALPLSERIQTRLRFERVSRGWRASTGGWANVSVYDYAEAVELLGILRDRMRATKAGEVGARDAGLDVRSLKVRLAPLLDLHSKDRIADLLRLMPHVESLEFVVSGSRLLESEVVRALARLVKITHFKIAKAERSSAPVQVTNTALVGSVPHWPNLESLSLGGCKSWPSHRLQGKLESLSKFSTLEIEDFSGKPGALSALLSELPPSIRKIRIVGPTVFYGCESWTSVPLPHKSEKQVAAQLTSFELHDLSETSDAGAFSELKRRGWLDPFVLGLTNATHITISPIAISNFADLVVLVKLEVLQVLIGTYKPHRRVESDEFVWLFTHATSLNRVWIDNDILNSWSDNERELVYNAWEDHVAQRHRTRV